MSENESRLTHAWVTSRTQWVTSRTPWVTSRTPWVTSRTQWVTSRTQWVTSDACTSHVTNSMSHMHETRHKLNATHVWVTPHTQYIETRLRVIAISVCERSSHVSHMNASYLSHRWVTSLTHISRVSIYSLLSLYHLIAIERITSCHELNVTNWQWLTSQSTHCYLRITSLLSNVSPHVTNSMSRTDNGSRLNLLIALSVSPQCYQPVSYSHVHTYIALPQTQCHTCMSYVTNSTSHVTNSMPHNQRSALIHFEASYALKTKAALWPPKPRLSVIAARTWDMTHSYVRHDAFICETWLMRMCNMTHAYVRHDAFICETWLIHMWDMTQSIVRHDSCKSWLITIHMGMSYIYENERDMTHGRHGCMHMAV